MKAKKQGGNSLLKDKLAGRIAAYIIRVQLRLCRRLSAWESRRSLAQKKWLFFLFTGICGTYCLLLLINGFRGKTDTRRSLPVPVDSISPASPRLPVPGQNVEAEPYSKR